MIVIPTSPFQFVSQHNDSEGREEGVGRSVGCKRVFFPLSIAVCPGKAVRLYSVEGEDVLGGGRQYPMAGDP